MHDDTPKFEVGQIITIAGNVWFEGESISGKSAVVIDTESYVLAQLRIAGKIREVKLFRYEIESPLSLQLELDKLLSED